MRHKLTLITLSTLILAAPLLAQPPRPLPPQTKDKAPSGSTWTRVLSDRAKRGTLHDGWQVVRGDSGKWNDNARLQTAPSIRNKPANVSLDDWADQLLEKPLPLTSGDSTFLVFRTRQLNDNDRVWVERVERRGSQFTVVVNEAIWQGRYQKNFTYYDVVAVSLGKLEPGKYSVKWIIKPLQFSTFEGSGPRQDSWPREERPVDKKPTELSTQLTVAPAP